MRDINRKALNPIIAANDQDGIATFFVELVDWLFFGEEEYGTFG